MAILQRGARNLAFVVAQVVNVLDVDTVIFGGPLWDALANLALTSGNVTSAPALPLEWPALPAVTP